MMTSYGSAAWLSSAWEVLVIFLIPFGGGIPSGVILAQSRGLDWPSMVVLYFISDVILACLFEPIMKFFMFTAKRSPALSRFVEAFKTSLNKTISKYGVNPSPFLLVLISFGIDPMTGRTAALMAGYHFIFAWAMAILGDMLFFGVLMVSTLCLNNILGDGTWTAIIITVAMIATPPAFKRVRDWWRSRR